MLRTSTRNVAYEVISCLIENGRGVLTEIIKFLTTSSNRYFVQEDQSSFLDNLQKKQNSVVQKPNWRKNLQCVSRLNEIESVTEEEAEAVLSKAQSSKQQLK
jgi:tRNA A22 N-methylase